MGRFYGVFIHPKFTAFNMWEKTTLTATFMKIKYSAFIE
jgi:hypothetical protein